MTDYPYSKQIYDKILADWRNAPLKEWVWHGFIISHPSIGYELLANIGTLGPRNPELSRALSWDDGQNLYKQLIAYPKEKLEKTQTELAAKQFLGL